MKITSLITGALLALATAAYVHAEVKPGPKGGQLLETKPLRAEFFINAEKKAEITFYDEALQPVAPADQIVVVNAEPKSGRQILETEKTATGFVTKTALPEGEVYRLVVQVKETPSAKSENFRLQFNLSNCAECSRPEYACTCGH